MRLQGAIDDGDDSGAIPVRCGQCIVSLAQGHEPRGEYLPRHVVQLAAKRPVGDRHDRGKRVLHAMLQFFGEKMLALGILFEQLGRFPLFGDVARDRKQMRGLPALTADGRNLNVPIARVAFRRVGSSAEPRGVAGPGAGHGGERVSISLAGPKSRPGAPLQRAEILDFHHPLAAFAHEDQAAFEIEDLDAIAATGKDTPQQVGVFDQIGAGGAQLGVQSLDGIFRIHVHDLSPFANPRKHPIHANRVRACRSAACVRYAGGVNRCLSARP